MSQINAAQFISELQQDRALVEKVRSRSTARGCVEVAASHGYKFSEAEFLAELAKLSDEALVAIVNPGIAPRHHLKPH